MYGLWHAHCYLNKSVNDAYGGFSYAGNHCRSNRCCFDHLSSGQRYSTGIILVGVFQNG